MPEANDATPAYYRIYLTLRDQILNGIFNPREPMPSEQQLCKSCNVSRGTLRRALQLLEEEGLLVRRQGAKTYPLALGYKSPGRRQNLDMLAEDSNYQKLFHGELAQQYQVIAPDKQLARQFPQERQLGRVARARTLDGKPYCLVVTYMPLAIAEQLPWKKLGSKPLITAVQEAGYDFVRTDQTIRATAADAEIAATLQIPVGSPLLCVSGVFIDAQGLSVMRKDGFFRPETFEYRMTLHRSDTDIAD